MGRCNYFDGEKHTSRYFLNAIYIGLGARIVQISDGTRRFWGIRELSFAASMFLLLFERNCTARIFVSTANISWTYHDGMCGKCPWIRFDT